MHALSLLRACALTGCVLTGCGLAAPGPEPTLHFPEPDFTGDALGDFGVNLRITAAIEQHALRKPELSKVVDVQVEAMLAYAKSHGRGALHARSLPAALPAARPAARTTAEVSRSKKTSDEYQRLYGAAVHSMAVLSLAHGSAELSRVALNALLQTLGRDASLTPGHEQSPESGNLVFAQRDGIAFLAVRVLDDEVSVRVQAVLEQWAAAEHPPRAVIIDLSRCEEAAPDAAAKLVYQLAPGRLAFSLMIRDEKTGKPKQHVFGKTAAQRNAFDADSQWSSPAYATTPVFVLVSEHTASLAEAAAHALREHRAATVLGLPTRGDGHLWAWFDLPDHARFSFTIGDVLGVDGEPLLDKPLVPDVCRHGAELVTITPRTVAQARTLCDASLPTQDEAIDYARRVLSVEAAPLAAPLAPPQAVPNSAATAP